LASLLSAQATGWPFSSKKFWPEYTLRLMNRSAEEQPQCSIDIGIRDDENSNGGR
jgi:hypothetical protein